MSLEYTIIKRPRRRRMSIEILPSSEVRLLVPEKTTDRLIKQFIQQHEDWIEKTLKKIEKNIMPKKQFVNGESFLFLGENYTLVLKSGEKDDVYFENKNLIVTHQGASTSKDKLKQQILNWYKERAKEIIPDRVVIHSEEMRLSYNKVRIKTLKTRWGSCSSLKNLNFNWVLMMTPIEVLDYVVIHELAHLVHMNHSKRFWDVVATYCPEFKQHKKWLCDYVGLLHVIPPKL